MDSIVGIILAAGRGSRMKELTRDKPKCLLELLGRPLLHWQIDALGQAGISRIIVVQGYLGHMLKGNFETIHNPRWNETNMVQTLMCALPLVTEEQIVVSYADIVYRPGHVQKLIAGEGDICLTYDRDWEKLWRLRNENPLDDAETFATRKGKLVDIGGKPDTLAKVEGQYMGLLKFSRAGLDIVKEYVIGLLSKKADKMDMTWLLRDLLQRGTIIHTVDVGGGWCECDSEQDMIRYEKRLKQGDWLHDWRK